MPLHIISYCFLVSFVCITFLCRWITPSTALWAILPLCSIFVLLFLKNNRSVGIGILFICAGAALAMANVKRTTHILTPQSIDYFATSQKVKLEGYIADEPDKRPMQIKYTVEVNKIQTESGVLINNINGKVLVSDLNGFPEYEYKDKVKVIGTLEKPERIEEFDYAGYLSKEKIYAVIYRAEIQKISNGPASIRRWLYKVKSRFEMQINKLYPEPHASFMAGLLTGSRKGIPESLMNDFNTTGLTHIIAISGYNITIVITIIGSLLFWIPLKLRFLPEVIAIIAFTLFVGASAAVVRAAIMGILGLLALQTGRQSNARMAMLWTIFLMLLWNPKMLWHDAGFQLSFLAVFGLVELGPVLENRFEKVPEYFGIKESLQMTVAAQISAIPIIVLLFGRLSIIAPIANMLVAPFIPLAMLFGFISTLVSFFVFFAGQLIAYIGWGFLQWIILVATLLSKIPFSSLEVPYISPIIIVIYYVLLLFWIIRRSPNIHT